MKDKNNVKAEQAAKERQTIAGFYMHLLGSARRNTTP